jgi:secreted trypsin-like serine protease
VGITSYSRCEVPGYPGIYTRLAYYINWMNSIIKSHNDSLYITTTRNPPVDYTCDRNKVPCGCGYKPVKLPTSRIIGGEDAIPNSWSMIVSIRGKLFDGDINETHFCGGTILNEWYILTAAHCVDNSTLSVYLNLTTVAVGIHRHSEPNQTTRKFDRIIIHPLWQQGKPFSNDIALLHLSEPLDFETNPFISRTCRPPPMNSTEDIFNYPLNGTTLAAIGWGEVDDSTYPEILQQVILYAIHNNDSTCANSIYDHEVQLCAGVSDGRKSKYYIIL